MKAKSFSIQAWSARFGQSKTHVPNSLSPFFFSLLLSISIFSLIFHSQIMGLLFSRFDLPIIPPMFCLSPSTSEPLVCPRAPNARR